MCRAELGDRSMTDRYQQLVNTPVGQALSKQIGLPNPAKLERYAPGQPVISGPVALGAAEGSRLGPALASVLAAVHAEVMTPMDEQLRAAAADAHLHAGIWNPEAATDRQRFKALVFDATGIRSSEQLTEAWAFLHPTIRRVLGSGRVIVRRHAARGLRIAGRGDRPAGPRGARARGRQGAPPWRDRPAAVRAAGR